MPGCALCRSVRPAPIAKRVGRLTLRQALRLLALQPMKSAASGLGVEGSRSSRAGELHPCDRVTGGSCPPPVPTERGVRFLLRCTFGVPHHALRQVVHSSLLLFVPSSFPRSASSSLCIEGCHSLCMEPASPQNESPVASRFPLALPFSEYYQLV